MAPYGTPSQRARATNMMPRPLRTRGAASALLLGCLGLAAVPARAATGAGARPTISAALGAELDFNLDETARLASLGAVANLTLLELGTGAACLDVSDERAPAREHVCVVMAGCVAHSPPPNVLGLEISMTGLGFRVEIDLISYFARVPSK